MIDEIDRKILKELQMDARTSFAELGRRVGLTTPAVIDSLYAWPSVVHVISPMAAPAHRGVA